MSVRIKLCDLQTSERENIIKRLKVVQKETEYNKFSTPPTMYPYDIVGDDENGEIYLPMYWGLTNVTSASRKSREEYTNINCNFSGSLRPLQKQVKKEAIEQLNKFGTCILSLYTGAGKTITSINIACKIGLKCVIICHRLILIDQWKDAINAVVKCARVQIIKSKAEIKPNIDFYIVNAQNVPKWERGTFDDIGFVIVDEVHLISTERLSESFNYIQPRYFIGLSATPYRKDGLDVLLDIYFGKNKIFRKMYREHYAIKCFTSYEVEYSLAENGKINWNSLLEWQTSCVDRNELIVSIVKFFKDRNFLILSKRVKQVEYLVKRLEEEGESVTSLVGIKKFFDYKSRVLVATVQKAGVGFDHKKLDSLILASDVEEYFIQYLGRVFRVEHTKPIIFDMVDNLRTLSKHYSTRKNVYREHGGLVYDFNYKFISELNSKGVLNCDMTKFVDTFGEGLDNL